MKLSTSPAVILNNQRGFTLIELIMVIVILGILAVVAIPKYSDMKSEAYTAAVNGVYGAAQAATAINFSANLVGKNITKVTNGASLLGAMDGTPDGWSANGSTIVGPARPSDSKIATITVSAAETSTAKATLTLTYP